MDNGHMAQFKKRCLFCLILPVAASVAVSTQDEIPQTDWGIIKRHILNATHKLPVLNLYWHLKMYKHKLSKDELSRIHISSILCISCFIHIIIFLIMLFTISKETANILLH